MIQKRIILSIVTLILFASCKKDLKKEDKITNCSSTKIELVFLTKYLIKTDTCNHFNKYSMSEYYNNDRLVMSGFSERISKQGKWSFFDKKSMLNVEGEFNNSQPKGTWEFKDIGDIVWETYNNLSKKYLISIPKDWVFIDAPENDRFGIFDPSVSENGSYNLKLVITSLKLNELEGNIRSLYESTVEKFKKKKFSNIENKQVSIDDFNEVYEIKYEEVIDNTKYYNTEFFYSFKDRFYLLSFSRNENASYDYSVVQEILETSFKMSKD